MSNLLTAATGLVVRKMFKPLRRRCGIDPAVIDSDVLELR